MNCGSKPSQETQERGEYDQVASSGLAVMLVIISWIRYTDTAQCSVDTEISGSSQGRCGEERSVGEVEGGRRHHLHLHLQPCQLSRVECRASGGVTLIIIRPRSTNIVQSISLPRCSSTKLPQDRWRASILISKYRKSYGGNPIIV